MTQTDANALLRRLVAEAGRQKVRTHRKAPGVDPNVLLRAALGRTTVALPEPEPRPASTDAKEGTGIPPEPPAKPSAGDLLRMLAGRYREW